jgi:hypothetical protein
MSLTGEVYISSNGRRLHFGLGGAIAVHAAEIHWPSGAVEKPTLPSVDRIFTIEEGKGITGELRVVCKSQLRTAVLSCLKQVNRMGLKVKWESSNVEWMKAMLLYQ